MAQELRAFLDYVGGKSSDDPFIQKMEEAVKEAKKNREWRFEYMTLLMRDQENSRRNMSRSKTNWKNSYIRESSVNI